MSFCNRTLVVLVSLLLARPGISLAASDCSQQIDDIQRHLQLFDREARPLGTGFLRDDGLGVALEAFKKPLDRVSSSDRLSPGWRGLPEAQDAKNKLQAWDERLKRWGEGIAGYKSCLKNPVCSIGDLIEGHEISNREFAVWLKSFAEEGLEKATENLEKASEIVKNFTARVGSATTGAMASVLMCTVDNGPRAAATSVRAPAPSVATTPRSASSAVPPAPIKPSPVSTPQPTLSIDHEPVACAVAERFPRLVAHFTPADAIARAQVLFQGDIAQEWYAVAMKEEGPTFSGVLPKPKKSLKAFRYYIEVTDKALGTNRTADFTTSVVGSASDCKGKVMAGSVAAASVLLLGPAGAAAVPLGFASTGVVAAGSGAAAGSASVAGGGGGLSTVALVGIVGGAGLGVAAVAAKGGGSSATTSTSSPTPPAPTPAPTPTPTPVPSVTQYDGNYRGGFTGSFGGSPVFGPVVYNVNNGRITLSEPGDGTGTVTGSGAANFAGRVDLGIGVDCSFQGSFLAGSANGTWSCMGSGSSGSGIWNAQRQ